MEKLFIDLKSASRQLQCVGEIKIRRVLNRIADQIIENIPQLLKANDSDLAEMDPSDPKYDRLQLSSERLSQIADDMRHVATLPSPLGIVEMERTLPNGLELSKVTVPFGVIGVIYEARPNVTYDVVALCLMAGSAVALKGGHQAAKSNRAAVELIHSVLIKEEINPAVVTLLPDDRSVTDYMLKARGLVDLIIPRGSASLIKHVVENAQVPVIETGAGVCHTYVDSAADIEKARNIVMNGKTRRVSVCNALDCLVINTGQLGNLYEICKPLASKNVEIFADKESYDVLKGHYPAELLKKADIYSFGTEFLGYKMSIATVKDTTEAISHINRYGSGHSESIVTENQDHANQFLNGVDAACVYHNAPTSFTDGGQFGMGAEIGISTQKLHARGPMALHEITTYKWLIRGNGQTRP